MDLNEEISEVLNLVKKENCLNSCSVYKGVFVLKMFSGKDSCLNNASESKALKLAVFDGNALILTIFSFQSSPVLFFSPF